jgi:cytochrome c-type biogenesis protein CcmE
MIYLGFAALGLAVALALAVKGLRENVTYFYTPSDVLEKRAALLKENKHFRLGGMIAKGSVRKRGVKEPDITFTVSDLKKTLKVHYKGLPPDLFREGQGIVAEGKLVSASLFEADMLLAKHDEKYMPPEIARNMGKK